MNFVFKSAYAPVGARPIHHWTMARLLREFGVATIEPPRLQQKVIVKEIAKQCGRSVRTIENWRSGGFPRKHRKGLRMLKRCRAKGFLNTRSLGKRRKYNLWDLWDMVKERWKQLSRMLHPDVNRKSHSEFATMCRIYLTLKERFRTRGIA